MKMILSFFIVVFSWETLAQESSAQEEDTAQRILEAQEEYIVTCIRMNGPRSIGICRDTGECYAEGLRKQALNNDLDLSQYVIENCPEIINLLSPLNYNAGLSE